MASIFKVYSVEQDPKEWYSQHSLGEQHWEWDEKLSLFHSGSIYASKEEDGVSYDDFSDTVFFGMGIDGWIRFAGGKELIYGYYDEATGSAEFVHIKDGVCIREYREYNFGEVDTDEGDEPPFDDWVDVATFVDENLYG